MTTVQDWFQARLRPLVSFGVDGEWLTARSVVAAERLARTEATMLARDGADQRVALTCSAGWTAGYVAFVLGLGAVRDGVLLRLSSGTDVEYLRHVDGYLLDLRFAASTAAVEAGHPLAGGEGVDIVPSVPEAFNAEIAVLGEPWIKALSQRSGRGLAGLWNQAADGLCDLGTTLARAEPELELRAVQAAVETLHRAPGAPWKQRPTLWLAEARGTPLLVERRGGCCLWYRADSAQSTAEEGPNYCAACRLRTPADVEARAAQSVEHHS